MSDFTAENSKGRDPGHNYSSSNVSAVAAALNGGTDTNCGTPNFFSQYLLESEREGLVPAARIDSAFRRVALSILRLGLLDVDSPFDGLSQAKDIGVASTDALAKEAAAQSIVLLGNAGDVLPLRPTASVALIGPHGNTTTELLGMYVGTGNRLVTNRSARSVLGARLGGRMRYEPGLPSLSSTDTAGFSAAAAAAGRSDAALVLLGLCESGHGCSEHENLDRSTFGLPPAQLALLKLVHAARPNATVCAFISGGPLSVDALDELCTASLWLSYPGQAGATALVDAVLGSSAPSGRLPFTLHWENFTQVRGMTDMAVRPHRGIAGATYRWWAGPVLRPFGFGSSLARWAWAWESGVPSSHYGSGPGPPAAPVERNTTTVAAAARQRGVLLTFVVRATRTPAPADARLLAAGAPGVSISALGFVSSPTLDEAKRMFGFARSEPVAVGSAAQLALEMRADALTAVDESGARLVRPGRYEIAIEGLRTTVVLTGTEADVEPSPFEDHSEPQ